MQDNQSRRFSRRELLLNPLRRLRGEDPETPVAHTPRPEKLHVPAPPENPAQDLENANRAYEGHDWDTAVAGYRTFLRAEPDNFKARRRLGYCLYQQGQFIQARVELERVLRAVPDDNESRLYLGLALMRMKLRDKAAAAWKEYFEPGLLEIQREINVQLAFLETDDPPSPDELASAVEKSIEKQRESGL